MALAGGKNVDDRDPKKAREKHQKAMREVVEKAWDKTRNDKIKKLLEDGPEVEKPKKGKHRKP